MGSAFLLLRSIPLTVPADDDEPEGEAETDATADIAEGSGKIQPIDLTPATAAATSPALLVSGEVLGVFWPVCSMLVPDSSSRLWFQWNCSFQGHTAGPCCRR